MNHRQRIEVDRGQEPGEDVKSVVEKVKSKERIQKKDNIIKISDIIYTPVESPTRGFRNYTKPTRDYRRGKTIWIDEYKKNAGKDKKSKKYDLDL